MKLINQNNGQVVAESISIADTFLKRLKGLMFTKKLPSDCALYLKPCNGIHTFFMRYSIDVLHLDSECRIVAIEENLKPWKLGKIHSFTTQIIELSSGVICKTNLKIGNRLEIIKEYGD